MMLARFAPMTRMNSERAGPRDTRSTTQTRSLLIRTLPGLPSIRPERNRTFISFAQGAPAGKQIVTVRLAVILGTSERRMYLVHQPPKAGVRTPAVAPGVRALSWRDFVEEL